MTDKKKVSIDKELFEQAKNCMVGGVNSPVRSFNYVGSDPVLIKRGKGSKIYDHDDNEYIDYVLSYGALMLGHSYPEVVRETKKSIEKGLSFGTTTSPEVALAGMLKEAVPFMKKMRFVNSGTEAVMSAVRLARGYTSRDKIVKMANAYHGHADHFLVKGGSGLASLRIPLSKGVPEDFIKHTLVADNSARTSIDKLFKRYPSQIAAVIVEPVGGNYGVNPPDVEYLKYLRKITKKYGSLLIFDEVITGFRFFYGAIAEGLNVIPDIICMGKIIGGGLPVGVYGGSKKIMDNLAPLGQVYQASTFGGNPVVMSAGSSTLKALYSLKDEYKKLIDITGKLCLDIGNAANTYGIGLEIKCYGTMFSFKFREKADFEYFHRALLDNGVYIAPSEYEVNFISFAHKKKDITRTLEAVNDVFIKMTKRKKGK